jgi:outer membrane autotransporter protein
MRSTMSRRLAAILLSGTALTGLPMVGAVYAENWTGTTSTDWFTPGNWDGNAIPNTTNDATFSTVSPNPAVLAGGNGFADNLLVGDVGFGGLTISGGGTLTVAPTGHSGIGEDGGTGTLLVTGSGSSLIASGNGLVVGLVGNGTLAIANGGLVSSDAITIGAVSGSGTVTVDGTGSILTSQALSLVEGPLNSATSGTLSITNGGHVIASSSADIGHEAGQATVTVDGAGSLFQSGGLTTIGGFTINGSNASVSVTRGASFTSTGDIDIGGIGNSGAASAVGTVLVDGAGSQFNSAGNIIVGDYGIGNLTVQNSGQVDTGLSLFAGLEGGSNGTIVITGAGSSALLTAGAVIGGFGTGSLSVLNGATLSGILLDTGFVAGSVGTVTVDGAGSLVAISDHLYIGTLGTSTLTISGGGTFNSANISEIGYEAGAIGTVTVTGQNSTFTASDGLIAGDTGTGTLVVQNGGLVNTVSTVIGASAGGVGTVTVTGAGSSLRGSDVMSVGFTGTGALSVLNGGSVTASQGILAGDTIDSVGTATVDGAGSSWGLQTLLLVGDFGTGNLTVSNGGVVNTTDLIIGSDFDAKGFVNITDPNSQLNASGMVNVAIDGSGQISVGNGAVLSAPAGITLAVNAASVGELDIGAAPPGTAVAPGTLNTPTVTFGAGTGLLIFNHTSTNYVFAPVITGHGLIGVFAGTTILTADSSGFTGGAELGGGTLLVNGTLGGNGVSVLTGTLGGSGRVAGAVIVADTGTLKGVEGQTLTIDQNVLLSNASIVDVTLGAPGGAGLFHVGQDLTLDGVLNITAAPGFNAGVYRLFDYGGVLTDNELDIGATPSGTDAAGFAIQTSVAGQVNLVDSEQTQLSFWDGTGNANNASVDGGSGVWSATAPNWTTLDGTLNGAMNPQPGFAVFEGAPGTVTVDDSAGAVAITGMQFASDGYVVSGDTITLSGNGFVEVRVGDGTAAGAGYTATVASVLTGSGTLQKTDLGTLILTADNSYTGGTDVAQGVLQLGNGGTTGSIVGDISLGDGAALVIDRSDAVDFTNGIFSNVNANGIVVQAGTGTTTLDNNNSYDGQTIITGGTLVGGVHSFGSSSILDNAALVLDQATDGEFANAISGSGSLTKRGAGAVLLTGANSYTGGTIISAGSLVGSAASFGTGAIADNAALVLDQPTDAVFANAVTGTGSLTKQGAGKLSVTGTNSYTGGTVINAGTLELGNGGTSGTITGDVADHSVLSFNRSDAVTFAGAISAEGMVRQAGTGTTTLTGANTYTGGTTIAAGTLAGSATSFGSGAIADNSALVIDQGADAVFANAITGSGSFTKQGAGSLNLTGVSTLTGATTVAAGRLAVNGALAGSVVTVANGATLGGNGTVGGIVAQTGSNVGPGNSIGALTVAGNYSAAAGSLYQVELDGAGHADRLNVTGTATIADGAIINVTKTDNAPIALGTQYTVLTAAGGVSGAYTVSGDNAAGPFTALNLTSDAHDVYLTYTQTHTFASAGGTPNQIATAGGADSASPGSGVVAALLGLPSVAAAQGAFDQLSGEGYASLKTAQIENSRFPREAALQRLDVGARQGSDGSLPSFWGQAYGSWGTTDGNTNAATLGYSSRGVFGGVDLPVFQSWRVGMLAGYSRDSQNVSSRDTATVSDSYHLGGYAGTQSGPFAVRLGVAYSWHDVTSARTVSFGGFSNQLTGFANDGTAQAFGEVGYHVQAYQIDLEPFANIATVSLQSGGFAETGGAAALTIKGDNANVTFTTLGLKGAYGLSLGDTMLTAHGSLGWRHAFGDLLPSSVMSFQTGNAFTIQGVPVAQDGLALDAGFDLPVARNILLGVTYSGQFASAAHDNAVKLNLDWKL